MADKKAASIIIKKVQGGGHGGHHGGAWKVAFADFMTALMCFFLVMWLMGSDEEIKAAIANYFNNPNTPYKSGRDPASVAFQPMGERSGAGESILKGLDGGVPEDLVREPIRSITEKEHKEIAELAAEITDHQAYAFDVTLEYVRFSLPEELIFNSGTAELKLNEKDKNEYLDRLGNLFKGYKGYLQIEGFLDDPPKWVGAFSNAYEFTLARSVGVMNYFVENVWVAEDRILPRGGGSRNPITSNAYEQAKKKNRRMTFTLTMQKPER